MSGTRRSDPSQVACCALFSRGARHWIQQNPSPHRQFRNRTFVIAFGTALGARAASAMLCHSAGVVLCLAIVRHFLLSALLLLVHDSLCVHADAGCVALLIGGPLLAPSAGSCFAIPDVARDLGRMLGVPSGLLRVTRARVVRVPVQLDIDRLAVAAERRQFGYVNPRGRVASRRCMVVRCEIGHSDDRLAVKFHVVGPGIEILLASILGGDGAFLCRASSFRSGLVLSDRIGS